MNRRHFLSLLSLFPFLGCVKGPKPVEDTLPIDGTELYMPAGGRDFAHGEVITITGGASAASHGTFHVVRIG